MKSNILTAILAIGAAQPVFADIYSDYADLGNKIVEETRARATHEVVAQDTFLLTDLGLQQMDLFVVKHPECIEQYSLIKTENEAMKTMTYEQLDERYHDGVGLPVAPRICYMGRSMIAHPYMALALHRDGLASEEEAAFYHEMEEVIERADWMREHLQTR